MRPKLKGYIAFIVAAAVVLLAVDLVALPTWHHTWSPELALALLLLTLIGEHLQFEVRRGWSTNCSAVPHLAAAFLLPPALAMSIAVLAACARAVRYSPSPAKLVFNAAAIGLAVLGVPAGLLYFAKRSMDRADRRSHNLAVTSAVGRSVAGTLDPERAFESITSRPVLDGLKLDGLALLPLGDAATFGEHVVAEVDLPSLRAVVVREVALRP